MRLQAGQAGLLQRRIVVVVEIVDADHLVAAVHQVTADMAADEAGRSGYENSHSGIHRVHRAGVLTRDEPGDFEVGLLQDLDEL